MSALTNAALDPGLEPAAFPPRWALPYRVAGPVVLVVGAALAALGMPLHAQGEADEAFVRAIAESPGQWLASHLLMGVGFALLAAGAVAVLRLARGRGATWTAVGVLAMSVGGACMALGDLTHGAVAFALADHVEPAASLAIQEAFFENPVMGLLMVPSMLLPLGVVILAIGLLRSGAVPRWAAIVLLVSPLFVQAGLSGAIPGLLTGVPLVVGLAVVARAAASHPST